MARNINIKKRGNRKRKQKSVYLIITEGKNKTETIYLENFKNQGKDFCIHFVKAGYNTDAKSLYDTLKSKWKELGLSVDDGDKGFVVIDMDNDEKKAQRIKQLIKENTMEGIQFVVSNPAFELWFILHFKFTTKHYNNGDALIKDLKKLILSYDKNIDIYPIIGNKTQDALANAKKLEIYYEEANWPDIKCNPRTDVGNLIKLINA